MINLRYFLFMFLSFSTICSHLSANVKREKDIAYLNKAEGTRNLLDVFYPEIEGGDKDVLVFIHGGSWKSGKKDTYWWLGRNFARKNVVAVNINYRIDPDSEYSEMAADAAAALKWVKNNIRNYGGNPERIFVMGHSAGGHLAALINTDPKYFLDQEIENPIRGIILNDSFGLDMHEYLLKAEKSDQTTGFMQTFRGGEEAWKKGSPLTYSGNIKNPYLIMTGEKTYPAIKIQSKRLFDMLIANKQPVVFKEIPGKKHIGMISQLIFGRNKIYQTILDFMAAH